MRGMHAVHAKLQKYTGNTFTNWHDLLSFTLWFALYKISRKQVQQVQDLLVGTHKGHRFTNVCDHSSKFGQICSISVGFLLTTEVAVCGNGNKIYAQVCPESVNGRVCMGTPKFENLVFSV